jgi:hypothetical protein
MSATFFTLMILTMLAVLGALGLGLFSMARGGAFARKYGNRLMQLRVFLQGAALVLFALAVLTIKK